MSESMTGTSDYRDLIKALTIELADGPKTTRQLKDKFCPPWPEWQLNNCLGYMGAIKDPGRSAFSPSIVYAPGDPNAPVPEVDRWLIGLFDKLGTEVLSAVIIVENARGPAYSKGALKQAYTRLGIGSVKRGGQWWRIRAAGDRTEAADASTAARKARALLDDNKPGVEAIKATISDAALTKAELDDELPATPRMTYEARWQWIAELVDAMALLGELVAVGEVHGEQKYATEAAGA